MKKTKMVILVLLVLVVLTLLYFFVLGRGEDTNSLPAKNVLPMGKRPDVKNTDLYRKIEKTTSTQPPSSSFVKNTANIERGAKEISMNSADEPGKTEAPQIELDEHDNPIVDSKGNPIAK